MSYYTRYLITGNPSISLSIIESGLRNIDPTYRILGERAASIGDLLHSGIVYGQIELSFPGDGLFEEDIEVLKGLVNANPHPARDRVLDVIAKARLIVAVEIGWQGLDPEDLVKRINPLWDWLAANYEGILQIDGEGFYEGKTQIFKV